MKTTKQHSKLVKGIAKSLLIAAALLPASMVSAQTDTTSTAQDYEESVNVGGDTTHLEFRCRNYTLIAHDVDSFCWEEHHGIEEEDFTYWSGLDLGLNGFVTPKNSLGMEERYNGFELDYAKSLVVNLNFLEKKLSFDKRHSGIYTGLGIEWNTYAFRNNSALFATTDTTFTIEDTTFNYTKNKLHATYLTVPLMLEFNSSTKYNKNFHFAAGVVGALKLGSNWKRRFEDEGKEMRLKTRDDYNLNVFKYSAMARVGYGDVTFFASYSLNSLFETNRGPEVYPFTLGIQLLGF